MITNKDIRVENGNLVLNGDKFPLDGQSPEAIMEIVEDNSDTTPTENSTAPITSGGVYTALGTKQDTLTFDNAPTDESTNPVTSGGVYTAISNKVKALPVETTAYTATTTNFEYTGVSVVCPQGHTYLVRVQEGFQTAFPDGLCISNSSTSMTEKHRRISYAPDADMTTFILNSGETAYVWGRWSGTPGENNVFVSVLDII